MERDRGALGVRIVVLQCLILAGQLAILNMGAIAPDQM